jgi:uncharacterized membrane protein YeaQ/YmgE (transglycosylase-associated protein family)
MELIISLISGAVGGNVAGGLMKNFSLGTVGNSVAGVVGGGLGSSVLGMMGGPAADVAEAAGGGMDIGSLLGTVATGGVGGGVLLAVVGVIKNMMAK